MSKSFTSIFIRENGSKEVLGTFNDRDKAVKTCVDYGGNYCLDSPDERRQCLEIRDFYILGCGPEEFQIVENDN